MMDREFKPPTSTLWSVLSLLAVLGWALPVQAQSEPGLAVHLAHRIAASSGKPSVGQGYGYAPY